MSRAVIRNSRRRGSGTGSAFAAACGAALAMLRMFFDSLLPLLAAATMLILAACLAAMGVKRFYDKPVSWRGTALISGLSFAGLLFFIVGYDSTTMRGIDLFAGPVPAVRADAETVAVASAWWWQPRRPARSDRRHSHHCHLCRSRGGPICCLSAPSFPSSISAVAVGPDPGADVPVDGLEFRLPADGDGPAAQRGRRSGAAR